MSNFSALIATIQANIKTNGNEEITGAILQDVLEAMVQALGTEAINNLETALSNEVGNRQNADGTLQNNIDAEALRAGTAEAGLDGRLDTIEGEIPSEASSSNKLADKAFVTNLTNALQNAITAINTKLGEGYVYVGIATATTNPGTPTGKVFYVATAAGTYTNFGGLVVTQGINILKYNGTAWSQEQLIGIDDVPTAGSNNLVKSGGIAKYKENRRQIILVNDPSTSLMKNVNNAIVELYIPDFVNGKTYLNSVRKLQVIGTTTHNVINIDIFNSDGTSFSSYSWNNNNASYNFGEGVQLLKLTALEESGNDGYVLIDWNKMTDNSGYGEHTELAATLLSRECSNIDRCPIIKSFLAGLELSDLKSVVLELNDYTEKIGLWSNGQYGSDGSVVVTNNIHTEFIPAKNNDVISIKSNASPLFRVNMFDKDFASLGQGGFTGGNSFTVNNSECCYVGITLAKRIETSISYIPTINGNDVELKNIVSHKILEILKGYLKGYQNKRQDIFVTMPQSGILDNVNDAIIELYIPQFVPNSTYINSVRKLQTVGASVYNTISIDVFTSENEFTSFVFQNNNPNYDFGDGVQLLTLYSTGGGNSGYVVFDWNKIANGTGYGDHNKVAERLLKECSNIDRCPIIKCKVTGQEIPENVVTRSYLNSALADYVTKETANNNYANKENTQNLLSQHSSQIGEHSQEIEGIEDNISSINDALSSLTNPLPSGAITGDNVWTGSNKFAQKVKGVGGTNDNEFVVYGQIKNTLHRNVDVADYGADPSETAANNTSAINNALIGGNKTVTITKPGVYLLNSSLLIDDNTEFICSKGVVLKKATDYNYVIRNIGASTRSQNSNIILRGINIDCDNKYSNSDTGDSPLYGSRGQILMFHVNNVRMYDITIVNSAVYAIQLCTFYDVLIDGFFIISESDGVHVNRGSHLVCKNGIIESRDDACPLNASDWFGSCPEVGSISDCHFENIIENQPQQFTGNFTRHLVGKWVDWYDGMEIVHGDKVVSNGHVYRANTDRSPNTFVSHTQPTTTGNEHDSGGFSWKLTNEDAVYEASISNITYKNIISKCNRPFITSYYETGNVISGHIYDRSVYPTVDHEDYPIVKDVIVENIEKPLGNILSIQPYIKYQYVLKSIYKANGIVLNAYTSTFGYITIEDCDCSNNPSINFAGTMLYMKRCIGVPTITVTGKIMCDSNINALPSVNIKGSICMYNDEPYYNNGTAWVSLVS